MKARALALMVAASVTLAGCTLFGPDRKPPKMPSPEHYSIDTQPSQLPVADGVAQKIEQTARPVPQWWLAYQSDELNRLVEEGLANSPSLAAARSTLKAAREQLRQQIGDNLFPSIDVSFAPSRQRAR